MVYKRIKRCYKLNVVWFSGSHDHVIIQWGRTSKDRMFTLTAVYPVCKEERKDDSYAYYTTGNNDVTINYVHIYILLWTAVHYWNVFVNTMV